MVITTLDDVKNVMTSFKALCDAYVFKPVGTAQLLNQLESLDWFHKSYKFGVIATLVEFEPGGFQFQENLANIFLKRPQWRHIGRDRKTLNAHLAYQAPNSPGERSEP